MKTTTQFDSVLSWSASKILHAQFSLIFKVLSVLVRVIRIILRFQFMKRLEAYLYRKHRDHNAITMSLSPVVSSEFEVSHVEIKVPDDANIVLHSSLFLPTERKGKIPAVLMRTPYDRNSPLLGPRLATIFVERGYAVLIQDTRGRFGSGGDFFPIVHEVNDGGTTVRWLRQQEWCSGKVGAFGVSYLGLTSYASCSQERMDACVPVMASSRLFPILYHGGTTFAFDLIVRWLWLVMNVMHERNPFKLLDKVLRPQHHLKDALHPAGETPIHFRDEHVVGKQLDFYRDVFHANELDHDFWQEKDILCDLSNAERRPPLTIVAGWFDFFVKQSFEDFLVAKKSSPNTPLKLICGSWSHWNVLDYAPLGITTALELFDIQLLGHHTLSDVEQQQRGQHQVIVHVVHSESKKNPKGLWLDFSDWPPPEAEMKAMYLHPNGELRDSACSTTEAHSTENNYDPENPTPHAGGMSFDWNNSGRTQQDELESRRDVSTFTSPKFESDVLVVGNVTMTLHLWSSNPHTDVFVKICDVDAVSSKSFNVLEKMTRLDEITPSWDEKGNTVLTMDLGPIATMFKKGHAFRIQISGGAHPAYLRHAGGEDHTSMDLKKAERKILHSCTFPSMVSLPVVSGV